MGRIQYLASLLSVPAAIVLTLAACGGDENGQTPNQPQEVADASLATAVDPTVIDVQMDEYNFTFDASKVTSGNVVFNLENVGDYAHQFRLVQVPKGPTLRDLVNTVEGDRQMIALTYYGGYQYLKFVTVEPGETAEVNFTEPLAPSLYTLICFARVPAEEPLYSHALRGMVADFTIQ